MALCDSGCAVALPCAYGNACGTEPKQGGINRIGFIRCDFPDFTDIKSQAEWDQAILDGDIVLSGLILASKPKGTFNKRRVNSCAPEQVTGVTRTIDFQDFNRSEHAIDTLELTFWNTILANPAAFKMFYITCDNHLYGPFDNFTLEVDEIIEDSKEGNRFIEGTITITCTIAMPIPTLVELTFDQDSSVTPC